jgi:kinetochore protein Mis13/DSN1
MGEQLADQALAEAASVLEERERAHRADGKAVDPMDALKGLAKVLNSKNR